MIDPNISQHQPSALSADVQHALQQPFAPDEIRLGIGQRRQNEKGAWECVAIPMLIREAIESRLDALVPGDWSTTSPTLVVAHDRLVVAAQVRIGSIAHTDYGELPFKQTSLLHEAEELIWSVPEAFEQAFLKACARFGLGRYLANLAREWVPYDTESRSLVLSLEQLSAHILKLHRQAGITLPPAFRGAEQAPSQAQNKPQRILEFANQETLQARDIAWIYQQCASHLGSLAKILKHWHVERLEDLSNDQLADVINSIHSSRARTAQNLQHAS